MHLIYIDESGNSGLNLSDPEQPVFALCAMVVAEEKWQSLEAGLKAVLDKRFPKWQEIEDFEIHASDMRRGDGQFAGMSSPDRIAFRDEWMDVGAAHDVKLIHRTVNKKPFAEWLSKQFKNGLLIRLCLKIPHSVDESP